jgi:hypothetical protein
MSVRASATDWPWAAHRRRRSLCTRVGEAGVDLVDVTNGPTVRDNDLTKMFQTPFSDQFTTSLVATMCVATSPPQIRSPSSPPAAPTSSRSPGRIWSIRRLR